MLVMTVVNFFIFSLMTVSGYSWTPKGYRLKTVMIHDRASFENPISNSDALKKKMVSAIPTLISLLSYPLVVKAVGVSQNTESKPVQYLSEPSDEFKDEVAKTAALKQKNAKISKEWEALVAKLVASEDSNSLQASIKDLREFLIKLEDIPTGFKKADIVKLCRSKKFIKGRKTKPEWTTPVEIEYQSFIQVINKTLSPDRPTKDVTFG